MWRDEKEEEKLEDLDGEAQVPRFLPRSHVTRVCVCAVQFRRGFPTNIRIPRWYRACPLDRSRPTGTGRGESLWTLARGGGFSYGYSNRFSLRIGPKIPS